MTFRISNEVNCTPGSLMKIHFRMIFDALTQTNQTERKKHTQQFGRENFNCNAILSDIFLGGFHELCLLFRFVVVLRARLYLTVFLSLSHIHTILLQFFLSLERSLHLCCVALRVCFISLVFVHSPILQCLPAMCIYLYIYVERTIVCV